jgi:nucleoside-diphosphate-sugar epimerase
MLKLLVTGARGFLGRHLLAALDGREWRIAATDLDDLDVCNARQARDVVSAFQPDVICHLAGVTGAAASLERPAVFYEVNVGGTLNILEAARLVRVRGFVFASSLTVHGASTGRPVDEDAPFEPRHPYAASKAAAEVLVRAYSEHYGLATVVLRPTLAAGPGQSEPSAVTEFIDTIRRDGELVLFGDGSHTREWVHPSDLAVAFIKAIERAGSAPAGRHEVFIVSSGVPVTMRGLGETVIRVLGNGAITYRPTNRQAFSLETSVQRARGALGWTPTIDIESIVREVASETPAASRASQ